MINKPTIIVRAYHGLGDSIYQIPVIEELSKQHKEVFVETPFPEFYAHLGDNLYFLRPPETYRTQGKMMRNSSDPIWYSGKPLPEDLLMPIQLMPQPGYPLNHRPRSIRQDSIINFYYGQDNLAKYNIIGCFEKQAKIKLDSPIKFNMPEFLSNPLIDTKKKIAVIRPPTDRAEWLSSSRQCLPEYVNQACKILKDSGYFTVSIADCEPGKEWLNGPEPEADLILHKGELSMGELLSLIKNASIVVGGVGWIVPATIAYNTPAVIVFGGRGGYDCPSNITDVRMNLKNFNYIIPDYFCNCTSSVHGCNKTITNFAEKFTKILSRYENLNANSTKKSPNRTKSKHVSESSTEVIVSRA